MCAALAAAGTLAGQEKTHRNSLGMELVLVPAGEFVMGCSPDDKNCYGNEKPPHVVKITKPFYMGKFEVTQGEWMKVMGSNLSYFGESRVGTEWPHYPVDQVSWDAVQEFLWKLNDMEKPRVYRLPTETEWEYAARAGTADPYQGGAMVTAGWYWGNSGGTAHPVGKWKPNAWGLYDMLGNVWEWVADNYKDDYYKKRPLEDPRGPATGAYQAIRGGSWYWKDDCFRVSYRYDYEPGYYDYSGGFRVVMEVQPWPSVSTPGCRCECRAWQAEARATWSQITANLRPALR